MESGGGTRRPVVWAAAGALLVTGFGGGAWALGLFSGPSACAGASLDLPVAAQPEIVPALRDAASRFNVERHRVAGRCVRARVTAVAPADYARDPGVRSRADAWVPESSLWLGVVRGAGDASIPAAGVSLAASPVVLATTRPVEEEFRDAGVEPGWKLLMDGEAGGLDLARRVADPGTGMSGTVAMIAVRQVGGKKAGGVARALRRDAASGGSPAVLAGLVEAERFDRPLAVTSEQAAVAYNGTHRPNPVSVLRPDEGTLALDHPYVVTARDQRRREAAEAFRDALGTRSARDILQRAGFRAPDGTFSARYAREHGLPEAAPRFLRFPTRKEIDRALASWKT
ncbi:substrate-binding domain-containing protein [Actinomadura rubrisoli]|uniref:ABC transporter substrate-binding protein n=1 Tax=Actinomadura rubrisoli TaxID=2530368 RepID=A0A4R5C0D5_9ACTN|nr:substrate-binding domain-containing protein [Actinomadura rubrisoli]TDD90204.1 hypothetical protein E1298_13215 [Actinomadura rubrisoli]